MSTPEIETERKRDNARLWLMVGGLYLLAGGGYMFVSGEWFIGFPALLDIAYFLGGGGKLGVYLEATIAVLLGGLFVFGAVAKWDERNAG